MWAAALALAANAAEAESQADTEFLRRRNVYQPLEQKLHDVSSKYQSRPRHEVRRQPTLQEQYSNVVKKRSFSEIPSFGDLPPRGEHDQPRRREERPLEDQPKVLNIRDDGKFHDFRDYEPDKYGGADIFSDCHWPKGTLDKHSQIINTMPDLDTPEYQALSAKCKEELIWRLTLQDPRREGFFKGYQFEGLFNQDMNLTYDVVTDTMPVGRIKKTHPVGTTAKAEWIPKHDQPYTGLF